MGDTKKKEVKKSTDTNTSTAKTTSNIKTTNSNKNIVPIVGIVLLVLIVIGGIVWIINGNEKKIPSDNGKGNEPEKKENLPIVTEQDIIKAYGFSIKDAEALVKTDFHSDNFTFSTEVTQDYLYIVTAKDKLSDTAYKIEVNPVLKTFVYLN